MRSSCSRSSGTATGSCGRRNGRSPRKRRRRPREPRRAAAPSSWRPMTPAELEALTHRPGPGSHRVTATIDGRAIETLADLPPLRDRMLFVSQHPSPTSVAAGHYHQGRLGQLFWRRLMIAGVIPPATPVADADDALVLAG